MTWTELVNRVITPFGHDNSIKNLAKEYLIEAQEVFAQETGCLNRWKWLQVPASQGYIDLPDDFIKLRRIEFNGVRLKPIGKESIESIHQSDETKRPGPPAYYYEQANRIYFYPVYSAAEWVALWYDYLPTVLADSATAYKKLAYDGMTQHFLVGETAEGNDSSATGVVVIDDNDIKTGTLTLSDIVGTFNNDEELNGSEYGVAYANGTLSSFATAGDNPDVQNVYQKYLVDYARSKLYEDRENLNAADRSMIKFLNGVEQIRQHFESRTKTGLLRIVDSW